MNPSQNDFPEFVLKFGTFPSYFYAVSCALSLVDFAVFSLPILAFL